MTTRELIEAVREPERWEPVEQYIGTGEYVATMTVGKNGDWISKADYDALRAACAAVLDEVIADCKQCDGSGERESWSSAGYHVSECRLCSNARALRERLR